MSAIVNVSEDEFTAVACAAKDAQRDGDNKSARTLDKLARKINAALTNATLSGMASMRMTGKARWQDMPTTLDET